MPPLKPMLAKSVPDIPPGMRYEPKWDGFRTIVFRDGEDVVLGSRTGKPLTRYFPEVVAALKDALPERCVLDGETVVPVRDALDFEALLQRVHPADSRVRMLAEHTPAQFVAFDLLALDDTDLRTHPLIDRAGQLDSVVGSSDSVHVTPHTDETETARDWFSRFEGAGLDGIVAKPFDLHYFPDKRAMYKIKHQRTADCVIAGYRVHKSGGGVGSLLLGLHDEDGRLQHVGVIGAFPMQRRHELETELAPLRLSPGGRHPWLGDAAVDTERVPGGQESRWQQGKDTSFVPLDPVLVVEVSYDHMEGTRFRHTAQFVRFRPDRDPESCTYDQLERPIGFDLGRIFAGRGPA